MWSRSEPGAWVSAGAHVALLGAALFLFGAERLPPGGEGIAVEVLTDNQFSEITKGEREAEVVQPEVKPRVDRQAERAEERDPGEASKEAPSAPTRPAEMKTAEREVAPPPPPPRREVAKVDPPEPPRREAERRPEPKAEAKPEPKRDDQAKREEARREEARREEQAKEAEREAEEAIARAKAVAERERTAAENKARAEAQARAKAEADARARVEAEAKALAEVKAAEAKALAEAKAVAEAKAAAEAKLRAEAKAKAEAEARAKRQAEVADRFNPGDIRQLLSAREPAAATGSTGREVQRTASLGTATGTAQRLNPSQRDSLVGFLQDQIQSNYYKVPGSDNDAVVLPVMEIRLNADGTLAAEPRLLKVGPKPIDRAVAEAALRAVRKAAPFRVPAQFAPFYGDWKLLNVEFTPT